MSRLIDLTGRRFGRLLVVSRAGSAGNKATWVTKCDCGTTGIKVGVVLLSGHTQSCGCLQRELTSSRHTTHGKTGTTEYRIWQAMIRRCENHRCPKYGRYGGRGITVCKRWRESFEVFVSDMGIRPDASYSIDRIDNSKGYEPSNCRWATKTEQARNTDTNHLVTANGRTMCIAEWATETGIRAGTIVARINIYGWTPERAVTVPIDPRFRRKTANNGR